MESVLLKLPRAERPGQTAAPNAVRSLAADEDHWTPTAQRLPPEEPSIYGIFLNLETVEIIYPSNSLYHHTVGAGTKRRRFQSEPQGPDLEVVLAPVDMFV
jgi:hypothetical protein